MRPHACPPPRIDGLNLAELDAVLFAGDVEDEAVTMRAEDLAPATERSPVSGLEPEGEPALPVSVVG